MEQCDFREIPREIRTAPGTRIVCALKRKFGCKRLAIYGTDKRPGLYICPACFKALA